MLAAHIRCFVRREGRGGRKGHALMIGEYKEKRRKEVWWGEKEEEEEGLSSSLFFILSLFLSSFVGRGGESTPSLSFPSLVGGGKVSFCGAKIFFSPALFHLPLWPALRAKFADC